MWQPELEMLERESLERMVVERMRATLGRVLNEAAWVRRLGGVDPRDIVHVEDWCKLPFLTKDELRDAYPRSEEHTSELQSLRHLVCRLLLEKKKDGEKRI